MSSSSADLTRFLAEEPYLRSLAHALAADGDDVAQQTWLHALEGDAMAARDPRAWLARIARNVASNLRRGERRRVAHERAAAAAERVPSSSELVAREERRAALIAAIDALPEALRKVVWLRFFEGLPPRRIAQELGVPAMKVSNQLRRALELLRTRLDAEHGDRRAWLAPLCLAAPGAGVPLVPAGAIAMSKTKIAVAAAALLAVAAGTYAWWLSAAPASRALAVAATADSTVFAPPAASTEATVALAPRETLSAPIADATTGDLRVHVRYADDHTPATGVTMTAWHYTGDPRVDGIRGQTDAAGDVRFTGLPARSHHVFSDRDMIARSVKVAAGQTTELDYDIPAGVDLSGIVVTAMGVPVAGAQVEVGPTAFGRDAEVLATTGDDGRFAIRSVTPFCMVGARAAGHAASKLRAVSGQPGSRAEVRIQLGGSGGVVEGRVVGPQKEPVANAVVVVGSGELRGLGGLDHAPPLPALVRTDAEGRFRAIGVAAGHQPLFARAVGLAPVETSCNVVAGGSTSVTVPLTSGATVRGFVLDRSEAPVRRARIEIGDYHDFAFSRAFTSAEGAFEVNGLPAGEVEVEAEDGALGRAKQSMHTEAGGVSECVLHPTRGIELSGRLVDEDGNSVTGVSLEFWEEVPPIQHPAYGVVWVDAEGRFVFANVPEAGTVKLIARGPAIFDAQRRGIDPRSGPVEMRVQRAPAATARIEGRLLDADGHPITNADINARRTVAMWGGMNLVTPERDGTFAVGPLPPGSWSLSVRAPGHPQLRQTIELAVGQTSNLGEIRLPRGGHIVAKAAPGSASGAYWSVLDVTMTQWLWSAPVTGEPVRSDPLPPGEVVLSVGGTGIAAQAIPVVVRDGEEISLEVRVEPGVRQRVEVAPIGEIDPWEGGVELRVLRGASLVQLTGVAARNGEPATGELWLAPGKYTLSARAGAAQGQVECTVGSEEGEPVRIELH